MRYDGILLEKVKCSQFKDIMELPLLFSFNVRKLSESELEAYSFLPPGVEKLLSGREFFILEPFNGGRFNIVKAYAKEVKNGKCFIVVDDEAVRDRRLFERFSFCPEEVGEFILQSGSTTLKRVFILDMSLKGVKLLIKGQRRGVVKEGELLTLIQERRVLTVKVLWEEERREGLVVGGQILKANFNVMKFIMRNYVSLVKRVLLRNA